MNSNDTYVWKSSLIWWVIVGVAAVLAGYAFLDTIQDMVHRWESQEEYGYGYLIPVISLFLDLAAQESACQRSEFQPSIVGLAADCSWRCAVLSGRCGNDAYPVSVRSGCYNYGCGACTAWLAGIQNYRNTTGAAVSLWCRCRHLSITPFDKTPADLI